MALFITFEGIDGCGKTKNAKFLYDWMQQRKIPCILTKEPGSEHVPECVKIREILLDPRSSISPMAEFFLFLADRAHHIESLIKPSLKAGINVISDRYIDSTRVYQSLRSGISRDKIDSFLDFTIDGLMPDITFLLDVPVEVGLERAKLKSIYKNGDRMEQSGNDFYEIVRFEFLKLAESLNDSHRFKIINTSSSKNIEDTQKEIIDYISKKLFIGD